MPYIVLSDAFWHSRFNADPRVIGMTVDLNKHSFTIMGVAPKTFNGTELFLWPDFWMPMMNEETINGYDYLTKRSSHGLYVLGVLKPGITHDQAITNLNAVAGQLARQYPQTDDGMVLRLVQPGLMGDVLGGPARTFLLAMMALALLVLAAACVNLAGIFAARSADRARELAIRLSIGSTRLRILRQVLTEAIVISIAGGLAGTIIAVALLGALTRWQPVSEVPIHVTVAADARTYAIALLFSLLSGILPGLLPARQIWRTSAMQAMKSGAVTPRPPAPLQPARFAPRRPDCALRSPGHRCAGLPARPRTIPSRAHRLRAARRNPGNVGHGHGRLHRPIGPSSRTAHPR